MIPPAPVGVAELEEVDVGTSEQARTQCGHEREFVGGVVDGSRRQEEVTDLWGRVDERSADRTERDAGVLERALEGRQRRARWKQHRDVAEASVS